MKKDGGKAESGSAAFGSKKFAEEICGQMKELNFLDSRFEIRISEAGKNTVSKWKG